jgi:hypothetical protein
MDNTELLRRRQAEGTDWGNKATWRQIRSGAQLGRAGQYQAQQDKSDQELQGLFSGMQQLGSGLGKSGLFSKKVSDNKSIEQTSDEEDNTNPNTRYVKKQY